MDGSPGIAFDEHRDRLVVFAGGETFEWDGARWEMRTSPDVDDGPAARSNPMMVYDSRRRVTVLYGGEVNGEQVSDTWTWDGQRWKHLNVEGPPGRIGGRAAYDSRRGEMVIAGGYGVGGPVREVWAWDGGAWNLRKEPSPPRFLHGFTFNKRTGRIVMFGGNVNPSDPGPLAATNETWHMQAGAWVPASVDGPSPRNRVNLACDLTRLRVVMYGGAVRDGFAQDTWEWDGYAWRLMSDASGPGPRADAMLDFDSRRNLILLYGGNAPDGPKNDLWSWDGRTWTKLD
jgi:hypothetical protein